jgi:type IV pilus assembly protein PilC
MLGAASRSERGALRRRLASLRRTIDSGQPIGEALGICAPEVPSRIVDLVTASERIGRMPQVLARLTREEKQRGREFMYRSVFGWSYAVVLMLFLFFILSGIMVFIIPKFEEIFSDFGAEMPTLTIFLISFSRWLGGRQYDGQLPWILWLLPLLGLFLLGTSGWALREMFHGTQRVFNLSWLWNRLIGYIPIARVVARDRGLADACQVIEQSLRAGDTMESAVFEASELKTLTVLRRRLQRFAEYLHAGQALRDAAYEAGMPPLMVGMLATGQASCNPVKVFEFLGRYYANKFSRAATVIQASVMPAIVLCMSVLVGWVVVSLFMPLVTLIQHTTIMVELI